MSRMSKAKQSYKQYDNDFYFDHLSCHSVSYKQCDFIYWPHFYMLTTSLRWPFCWALLLVKLWIFHCAEQWIKHYTCSFCSVFNSYKLSTLSQTFQMLFIKKHLLSFSHLYCFGWLGTCYRAEATFARIVALTLQSAWLLGWRSKLRLAIFWSPSDLPYSYPDHFTEYSIMGGPCNKFCCIVKLCLNWSKI